MNLFETKKELAASGYIFRIVDNGGSSLDRMTVVFSDGESRAFADGHPSVGSVINPRFEAFGEKHMRWIEKPSHAGLRFVGYADEINRSIRHTGWVFDPQRREAERASTKAPGRSTGRTAISTTPEFENQSLPRSEKFGRKFV